MTHQHTYNEHGLCFECDEPLPVMIWLNPSTNPDTFLYRVWNDGAPPAGLEVRRYYHITDELIERLHELEDVKPSHRLRELLGVLR